VRYQSKLDQEFLLGRSWWQGTQDSAVIKVKLEGDQVSYEIHRTRQNDSGPARQGQFVIR
jgi:hypothetical protein